MALHGHASIARLILSKGAGQAQVNKLLDLHSGVNHFLTFVYLWNLCILLLPLTKKKPLHILFGS